MTSQALVPAGTGKAGQGAGKGGAGESVSILGVAIRDIARLNTVAATVARHGFGELLQRSPISRLVFRGETLPEGSAELLNKPAAVRFRRLLEALGPTYIKLGQILSMRGDLLPIEYIRELEGLQDKTPTMPFDAIRQVIEEGLGLKVEDLFASFNEETLGTASIAQTYRAVTHQGDEVVIKVQRPGIETIMRGDLDLLYLGAKILEATIDEMQLYSPSDIVVEFERALFQELNFTNELKNLVMARTFLDPERDVIVPKPYPELSCRTVLTMEFFDGIPVRKLERGTPRAKHAVEEILHAGLKQILHDGFFHGDPHPGNLLINDAGDICMIDLGMMGTLSPSQRDDLVTLILAGLAGDNNTLARILIKIGTPTRRINMSEFKAEIEQIRTAHLVVESFDDYDSTAFSQAFMDAANRYGIKLNTEYSVLVKAAATIEGIMRDLCPDVDIVAIARPYAEQILRQRYSPQKLMEEAMGGVTGVGSLIRHLPDHLDQVIHDVETGNLQIRVVSPGIDDVAPMVHQAGSRVSLAVFAGSLSLCAAVLLPNDPTTFYAVPILSVVCILLAVVSWTVLWWWHFIGDGKKIKLSPWLKFFNRS